MSQPADDSPNAIVFEPPQAPQAMLLAVQALAEKRGQSLDEFSGMTMGEISELAQSTYGDDLPKYWRVWLDWNRPDQEQPMGDL